MYPATLCGFGSSRHVATFSQSEQSNPPGQNDWFRDRHVCQGGKIRLFPGTFARTLRKNACSLLTEMSGIRTVSLRLPLAIPAAMWETGLE